MSPARFLIDTSELLRAAFTWVVMPDRAFERAAQVQAALTDLGAHRSAGAVDLLIAATAELQALTLLHYDHDFEQIVRVTCQRAQWLAPPGDIP
jgi:predicted nucleic acid-binding protein